MSEYQPKTGARCHCKPGIQRDNCPHCEATGWRIDFAAIRARKLQPNQGQDRANYTDTQDRENYQA